MNQENLKLITVVVRHKDEGKVVDAMLKAGAPGPEPARIPQEGIDGKERGRGYFGAGSRWSFFKLNR